MIKCEWIHPDRLKFIPEAKMRQYREKEKQMPIPINQYRVEEKKDDYAVHTATVSDG